MKHFLALALGVLILSPVSVQKPATAPEEDAFDRYVTNLGPVDRIIVTAMGDVRPNLPPAQRGRVYVKGPLASVELKGERARELWGLWRGLKSATYPGCGCPGYLLEFYAAEERLLSAEVCLHCCNVTLFNNRIRGICGDTKSVERFQAFVTQALPYPKPKKP